MKGEKSIFEGPAHGTEELRALKEKVNTEGSGGEDMGGLYIGTKEETTKARQLAETEGRAPDLASYIVMHKRVLASPAEMIETFGTIAAKQFEAMPIGAMSMGVEWETLIVYFKDSTGNLAKVEIQPGKIAEFVESLDILNTKRSIDKVFGKIQEQLEKLGFNSHKRLIEWNPKGVEEQLQSRRQQKSREEQKKGFAF